MFSNKKRLGTPNPYMYQNPMYPPIMDYPNSTPNYDYNRLLTEINENRRLINELTKRVNRLETYLGIRDGSEHLF